MSLGQRRGLALLSGLLLWLSFPNPWALGFQPWTGLLAWVALVPLLWAVDGAEPGRAFGLGFLAGAACFVPGLFWLTNVKPLEAGAWPAWLALAAWCALYPGLFAWALERGLKSGWALPALWVPALWALTECLRGWVLGGFPWIGLGSSQYSRPAVLALAAALGEPGLHYAVALGGTLLYGAFIRPRWLLGPARSLSAAAMALLLAWLAQGQAAAQARWDALAMGPRLTVGVIQGAIDLDQPWTPDYRQALLARYFDLSEQAAARGARVLLWPESAFPGFFNEGAPEAEALRAWVRTHNVSILSGSTLSEGGRYTNSAVWVSPREEGSYAKRHLVPFGEYVPFRSVAPLLDLALARAGVVGFEPGRAPGRFEQDGFRVKPLICYESIFPSLARSGGPADLLGVLTVDTWYGRSAGPVWHASQALIRAVEGGCWVARSASTGISLFASPAGRLEGSVPLDEAGFVVREIRPGRLTPYQRFGSFPLVLGCVLLILVAIWRRKGPAAP